MQRLAIITVAGVAAAATAQTASIEYRDAATLAVVSELIEGSDYLATVNVTVEGLLAQATDPAQIYGVIANARADATVGGDLTLATTTSGSDTLAVLIDGSQIDNANGLSGLGYGGIISGSSIIDAFVAPGGTSDFFTFTAEPASFLFGGWLFTAGAAGNDVTFTLDSLTLIAGVFAGTETALGLVLDTSNGVGVNLEARDVASATINIVPAPGAAALFAAAGLVARRRR